jgi:tetratricopeptide (TPR) repeat protein
MTTPTIDELRAAVEAAASEGDRLTALLALADALLYTDPHETLALASESLEGAERLHDQHAAAEGLRLMGLAHGHLGDYPQAKRRLEEAQSLYEVLGDHQSVLRVMNNIGVVFRNLGEYAQALEQHQSALALSEQLGDRRSMSQA